MVSLSTIWSGRALLAPQQLPREGSFLCELPALPILPSPAPGMCPQLPAALLLSPESGGMSLSNPEMLLVPAQPALGRVWVAQTDPAAHLQLPL